MSLSEDVVLRAAPGVEKSRFAGETVLLDAQGKTLRGLNATGSRVWELLDGQRSLADVAAVLAAEYRVDPIRVAEDVKRLAGKFHDRRLVIEQAAGGEAP